MSGKAERDDSGASGPSKRSVCRPNAAYRRPLGINDLGSPFQCWTSRIMASPPKKTPSWSSGCSCWWPRIHRLATTNRANMVSSTAQPSQVIGRLYPNPSCGAENQYRGRARTCGSLAVPGGPLQCWDSQIAQVPPQLRAAKRSSVSKPAEFGRGAICGPVGSCWTGSSGSRCPNASRYPASRSPWLHRMHPCQSRRGLRPTRGRRGQHARR
jgi:hypothetical protein